MDEVPRLTEGLRVLLAARAPRQAFLCRTESGPGCRECRQARLQANLSDARELGGN